MNEDKDEGEDIDKGEDKDKGEGKNESESEDERQRQSAHSVNILTKPATGLGPERDK